MCQFDSGIWLHVPKLAEYPEYVWFHDFVDINKMDITQKSGMASPWANGIAPARKCAAMRYKWLKVPRYR